MATKALANALKIRNLAIEKEINSILAPLNERKNKISLSAKALSVLSDNIKKNTIKYQNDIENHFNKIINLIQFRKKYLFNKLSLIEQKKLSDIDNQHKALNKSQNIVSNALTSCNSIIKNKTNNLKTAEKKQKIQNITKQTLNETELPSRIAVRDKIKCIFNDTTSSFISSLCIISANTLKPLPVITNVKCDSITSQSVTVRWKAMMLSSIDTYNKTYSDLYMRVSVNIDTDDEKNSEMNINHKDILFNENKQQYSCDLQTLNANKKYKICINCMEMDCYNNNKLDRSDFETINMIFKTKKPLAKMGLFKFQLGNKTMVVSNNGLSVNGYGQLRFGEYLGAEHKQVYRVTFSMKDVNPNDCGIGFATIGFINTHNNHRMIVYGNTKILMAKEFKNGKKLSNRFWDKGDEIVIEMNMKKKQGIMYRKFKNDVGINNLDEFYKVDLPDKVSICVRFAANTTQTLTALQQKFI
eukprot:403275_1